MHLREMHIMLQSVMQSENSRALSQGVERVEALFMCDILVYDSVC
jgi:hypothetical protein